MLSQVRLTVCPPVCWLPNSSSRGDSTTSDFRLQTYLQKNWSTIGPKLVDKLFFYTGDADFDVLLDVFDIVVPDLIYLSNERAPFLTEKNLKGPPDLVVEILSPSTKRRDQRLKRDLYERVGVREYWLVDPVANVVTVYRRGKRGFADPQDYSASRRETLKTDRQPKRL